MNDGSLVDILRETNLNLSTNPRGTDKGDFKSYIQFFYEPEFSKYRNRPIRLLEIGVRSGASLALWSKYFQSAEILGLDIERVGSTVGPVQKYLEEPNVKFMCADAYDPAVAQSLEGPYDILIDDGPHSLGSQKQFIALYLGKLASDGVLVIEDILGGFRDCYELMKLVPAEKYEVKVFDFRKKKGHPDDLLFVVTHKNRRSDALTRASIAMNCFKEKLLAKFKN